MSGGFQFCIPNCPDRRPGCQDSCTFHAEKKKQWAERKALIQKDREAREYTAGQKARNFYTSLKNKKAFGVSKWRRYGK